MKTLFSPSTWKLTIPNVFVLRPTTGEFFKVGLAKSKNTLDPVGIPPVGAFQRPGNKTANYSKD